MSDLWHWPLVIGSLIGVVMNIHRDKRAFCIWIVTNSLWCWIDFARGLYSQAALMAVYVGLAIYGLIEWSRKP